MTNEELARRSTAVREYVVKMLVAAGAGHPGGSLSIVEILQVLYGEFMHVRPQEPHWPGRDRLILSKGHAAPALYATLMMHGFFPEEELWNLRKCGAMLQGVPDMNRTPGIDMSTGSLGQGLSAGNGMALGARLDHAGWRTYVICGDGEIEEGIIWEAAMTSAHFKLDNLTLIIDHNKLQLSGASEEVMNIMPIADKFRDFHWHTITINGHDFDEIRAALKEAGETKGMPTVIIAETIKGKGVDFMENKAAWHNKTLDAAETKKALEELEGES
mgnify:FL=1